ncbi:hypothetical protein GCM10027157_09450 [Corynebacterium aquatimens]
MKAHPFQRDKRLEPTVEAKNVVENSNHVQTQNTVVNADIGLIKLSAVVLDPDVL